MRATPIAATIVFLLCLSHAFAQPVTSQPCRQVQSLLDSIDRKYYLGTVQWHQAIDDAINLCPTYAYSWGDKAMAYLLRGDFLLWREYIDKAVQLDSVHFLGSRAWYRMRRLHDYKGALKDFEMQERVAGFHPLYVFSVHSHMWMGMAHQEMGSWKMALEHYDKAIDEQIRKSGEEWVGIYDYLVRGTLKYKMGDFDGALSDLNHQVKINEPLADNYYYRGVVLLKLDRKEQARADFHHAKELLLGKGNKRFDNFGEIPGEIFLSDVENALMKTY